ncbi:MAG: class I SAM-dependent methyltransferase [Lachnospiraceae bacterium]|nr:class I SAM-dependent methyltransferase [Lachnospiraceae bacterium]
MTERIGKVLVDLTLYNGTDAYSDGDVEEEMLRIAKTARPEDFDRIVNEKKEWPITYHFSSIRRNVVDWYPVDPSMRVLEIGAGCGAVTPSFTKRAASVDAIELSKRRSLINAYRNRDCGNLTIKVGNFEDVERSLTGTYDLVTLIGVLEYAGSFISGEDPYTDMIKTALRRLSEGGRLLIAIENRLGMKYWAGAAEDHTGEFFAGIEGYPKHGGVRTFSRPELETLLRRAGAKEYTFYYPYPDYKFANMIFSDRRLPEPGELKNNVNNLDHYRMILFDESNAYDSLCASGSFPLFSNSFLIEVK